MLGIASIDGVISPLHEAQLSVLDRGLQYGDAVFEALRTFHRRPDALELHLDRLAQSCARLHIQLGVPRAQLVAEIDAAIATLPADECYVRIVITRGDAPEGLSPYQASGPGQARRIILVRALPPPPQALYEHGIRVITRAAPVSPLWSGAKPTAYLNNLLAVGEAQRAGLDDALLIGTYGELLEGATSSAFLVSGGVLYTPPLSLGILPGITRDRVLACAAESGIEARERLLHVSDVYQADELFLTSSVRLIVAVVEVDGERIASGAPGPVTRKIDACYRAKLARL